MPADQPNAEAQTCSPCRGTGRLISGLGGRPHEVRCPWCRGTGRRIPGIDAQQAPAEAETSAMATSEPSAAAAPGSSAMATSERSAAAAPETPPPAA